MKNGRAGDVSKEIINDKISYNYYHRNQLFINYCIVVINKNATTT